MWSIRRVGSERFDQGREPFRRPLLPIVVGGTRRVNNAVAQKVIPTSQLPHEPDEDHGRALLARIAAGDRDALADLCARYQTAVFFYLVRLTGDRTLAEDVFQDTLVAVWKSAGTFEGRSSVQTWLVGIARRQAHNTTRRRVLPRADVAELERLPASDPQPEYAALA